MVIKIRTSLVLLMLCLVLLLNTGMIGTAETAAGGLSEQNLDEITLDVEGVQYRLKKRSTFALVICAENTENEAFSGYMGVLAVDDNAKSFSLIELDDRMAVLADDEAVRLSDAYLSGTDLQESSLLTLEVLNRILPYGVIDHYIVFDMKGLEVLEGYPGYDSGVAPEAENVKQRLKRAKACVEGLASNQMSDVLEKLSGYVKSDLKSGALMKIADKAEKYEILPTVHFLNSTLQLVDDKEYMLTDEQEANMISVESFFEIDPYGAF